MLKNISNYERLDFLENLRNNIDLDSKDIDINLDGIWYNVKECLREISNEFKSDAHFENKLEQLDELFDTKHFNIHDFIKDCFVFGPFKFYKSLCEMNEKSLPEFLIRKYPIEMAYKYAN